MKKSNLKTQKMKTYPVVAVTIDGKVRPAGTVRVDVDAAAAILRGDAQAAPAKLDNGKDFDMGAQLTSQYERAVGGMTEVLKFGALMMMLRQHLAQLSTRGE
jgi:hypothetical protein